MRTDQIICVGHDSYLTLDQARLIPDIWRNVKVDPNGSATLFGRSGWWESRLCTQVAMLRVPTIEDSEGNLEQDFSGLYVTRDGRVWRAID